MAISIVMPALEIAQETGTLIAWRKKEGEQVARGETLLEIETDKAVMEIEAPGDGVLVGVKVHEGAVVPVGQTIAWIVAPGEVLPAEAVPSNTTTRSANAPARAAVGVPNTTHQPVASVAKISPKARRLARERGLDIRNLRGSGPAGEIVAADVLSGAVQNPLAGVDAEPLTSVGRLMAERTTQSWTTVPHFFLVREIDASAIVAARQQLGPAIETTNGVKLTHTDLLIALVARVLAKHPRLNSSWSDGSIHLNPEINIGVAMAVDGGAVAAVIHKADRTKLGEIAVQRRDLTERARAGRLRPSDISGATFTISNLGMYNVDAFSAIINPPQAAILAVGRIADRVVPVNRQPGIRPIMILTLSCDHRVTDGAKAATFLNDVGEAFGKPEKRLV
jgi:pyruvate dehydrogenase E2 component (dihydrolipoyllysine-residue acetyltransferase)